MRPTDVLKNEHRIIERMLRILFTASKKMQKGEEVDPQIFLKAVDFVRNFADKCHHGKEEDNLFPAIEKQGFPREGGPIGMMLIEHEEGRAHIRDLETAVKKYEQGDRSPQTKANITGHAIGYAQLLTDHIQKEDTILYDIADHVIPPAEQDRLIKVFDEVEERLMGNGRHEAYLQLVDELEKAVQQTPARA